MTDIAITPEGIATSIQVTGSRRLHAITQAMMLVANGKLPAWSAFDYAYAMDHFLTTGLPPVHTPKPPAKARKRSVH